MSRKPILGKGEYLVDSISKRIRSGPKKYPRTYDEGKKLVIENLESLSRRIPSIPDSMRMDKVVIGIKLSEGFLAKSYEPNTLFREFNFEPVGTKYWETENKSKAKMNYVKIDPEIIKANLSLLINDEVETDAFKNDIRKIEKMYLIEEGEVVKGFKGDWTDGRVELVLHPFDELDILIDKVSSILGENPETFNIKQYEDGPIFISTVLTIQELQEIKNFNPLRIIKPLEFGLRIENTTANVQDLIPNDKRIVETQSIIGKVGMIDGGIVENHSFLESYTNQNYEVSSNNSSYYMDHGTKVAGALMYGDLSQYTSNEISSPLLSVESIRVLPTSNPEDINLYEAIDLIEEAIPELTDVNVFNVSVGPNDPIDDDYISRFTYSLDRLAYEHNKLFVVAAGNDGVLDNPFNRIQVPSDMTNGLAVGAYSQDTEIAEYSSIGFGREGCVIKPELCEIGGPMLLLSSEDYALEYKKGTSFSSPLVARKAAEIMERNSEFNYLTTRALLIHNGGNAIEDINEYDGFGKCSEVLDMLESTNDKVTIVYNNEMSVSSHAKIRIPVPKNTNAKKFKISWTIVIENKPNPLNAESYTSCGIEDTFYPHEKKYRYTLKESGGNKKKTRIMHEINDSTVIQDLLEVGFVKSEHPVSKSSSIFRNEEQRRALLKWDSVTKKSLDYTMKTSLEDPFLIVHALSRDPLIDRVRYSVIVTIEAFDNAKNRYTEDLYQEILNEYEILQPIEISLESEIDIIN